jgi:hypothetical protein
VQDLTFDENKNKNKLFFDKVKFFTNIFFFHFPFGIHNNVSEKNISKSLAGNQIDQSVAVARKTLFSEKANCIVLFMIFKTFTIPITT